MALTGPTATISDTTARPDHPDADRKPPTLPCAAGRTPESTTKDKAGSSVSTRPGATVTPTPDDAEDRADELCSDDPPGTTPTTPARKSMVRHGRSYDPNEIISATPAKSTDRALAMDRAPSKAVAGAGTVKPMKAEAARYEHDSNEIGIPSTATK